MKYILLTIACSCYIRVNAQTSWKFDFGNGKIAPGYTQVPSAAIYNNAVGYGFGPGANLQSFDRKTGNALTCDFITANQPFFFSVKLPDGNYDVKIIMGDSKGTSATTVRVENRRLMLESTPTKNGEIISRTFSVHKRDSMIREAQGGPINKVRLKPREINYRHWDDVLTIEFNDSLPKICGLEITPNQTATTVFLAGNSTVVDQDREPWAAWGQMIPAFFEPGKVVIANYAESGETLVAFKGERRLQKLWSMAKPGDYLFIEFAHNDQKPGSTHLDAFTTYKQTLKQWIAEARNRAMIPVLVTSMHRRNFNATGSIINTLGNYPEAVRQTAAEENVALVDLNALSKTLYEAWGPQKSLKAFVHYAANTFPNQPGELKDNTHFSTYGAYQLARCVVKAIANAKLHIAQYLIKEKIAFDPAQPGAFEQWYWPHSPFIDSSRPDGN